jgi:hypothetical protein
VRFPFDNQQFLCGVIPAAYVGYVADRQQDLSRDLLPVFPEQMQVHFLMTGIDPGDIMPHATVLDLGDQGELRESPGFLVQGLTSDDPA